MTITEATRKFGIVYNGLQHRQEGQRPLYMFTDPQCNFSSLCVEKLDDLEQHLTEKREGWSCGKNS